MLIVNLEKHFNKTLAFLTTVQHTLASDLPLCLSVFLSLCLCLFCPPYTPPLSLNTRIYTLELYIKNSFYEPSQS